MAPISNRRGADGEQDVTRRREHASATGGFASAALAGVMSHGDRRAATCRPAESPNACRAGLSRGSGEAAPPEDRAFDRGEHDDVDGDADQEDQQHGDDDEAHVGEITSLIEQLPEAEAQLR